VNGVKKCEEILQKAAAEGRSSLLLSEARQICVLHHIPVPESCIAQNVEEAVKMGRQIGLPLALKIVSPQILHKTDVGGVVLNINSEDSLRGAYEQMIAKIRRNKPDAKLVGVLVQKMMPQSTEVIIGGIRDSQFGPAVMFGMGGIFAEVYEDAAFRVAPLDKIDALNLIDEIKGSKILKGFRGEVAADTEAIANILLNVSELMIEHNGISQLDLNPVIAYSDSACAVDSRIILEQRKGGE
jgi:acetate---CoA ligase (ADP-forming) subunit beta